jgi:hypothetical protein
MIASTIANINRDPKSRSDPYEPADFMPRRRIEKAPEPMTVDASLDWVSLLNLQLGGVDLRGAVA